MTLKSTNGQVKTYVIPVNQTGLCLHSLNTQAELLSNVYGSLYNIFLSSLYHSMETIPNLKVSEIQPYLNVLDHVRESGLITRYEADISARLLDLEDRVRALSEQFYQNKIQQLQAAPGVNRALPLLLMTDELEKAAKQLDKRFPEPLVGYVWFPASAFLISH